MDISGIQDKRKFVSVQSVKALIGTDQGKMKKAKKYCLECGKVRKDHRSILCRSCSKKGTRNPMYGKLPENHFETGYIPWHAGTKGVAMAPSTAFKKGGIPWNKGKKGEYKLWPNGRNMPWAKGKKHWNWNNGSSFEPYGVEFNEKLKEQIRKRDNYRCQECFRHQDELYTKGGRKYKLNIHHIDYDKKNNKPENLISLCGNCHLQTNFGREDWIKYFQRKSN